MTQRKQLTCGCLGLVAGLLLLIVLGASIYLINFALKPEKNKGRNYDAQLPRVERHFPWIKPWADSLVLTKAMRDTFILAQDGDRHHAVIIAAPQPTAKTAVILPGYTDCAINLLPMGYLYNKVLGMNLLIPDLHANGRSDGLAMQMGWKDRLDALQWIGIADSLFSNALTGRARIVVHGQSMGAATAMCVAGEKTPPSVKCFVEDCGYTSVWDEFGYELDEEFGLPEFPLLYTASALCKAKYGWSFGQASALQQVAKCHKPMLFIHGADDHFVPTPMVHRLYAAKPAPKWLHVFGRSKHACSYHDHTAAYTRLVGAFTERYL